MKYVGQLYGKVGGKFVPVEVDHPEDGEQQAKRIAELEAQLKEARELAHIGGWTK